MRRPLTALCFMAAVHGIAAASAAASTAVGVAEREFSISPFRRTVPAGEVRLNVWNRGEDDHDLEVRGPGGFRAGPVGPLRPGERATLVVTLSRPGVYRLVCTLGDHAARGMRAGVRVARGRS